jgi:hypothetical protein
MGSSVYWWYCRPKQCSSNNGERERERERDLVLLKAVILVDENDDDDVAWETKATFEETPWCGDGRICV